MTDLERLKERISVIDVLEQAGAEFPDPTTFADEVPFFCPFCDDRGSSKPAGRVNPLKNLWHCWACGRGGSVIDAAWQYLKPEHPVAPMAQVLTWLLTEYPEEEVLLDPWADEE